MNRGELVAAVKQRAGVAFDNDAVIDAVNEALHEVSTERDWEWLEDVWRFAAREGVGTYSPPYGWRKIDHVTLGGQNLAYINSRDSDTGERGYTIAGDRLVLTPDPPAAAAVVVRLVRDESDLTSDSAAPLLPETWHRPFLVNRAAATLLERIGEHQRADRLRNDAEAAVRRMVRTGRRRKGPGRIRIRPGGPV